MILIIALVVSLIAALLFIWEINSAICITSRILQESPTLSAKVKSLPIIARSFLPFALDLSGTAAIVFLLGAGGFYGFVCGAFISNVLSLYIIAKCGKSPCPTVTQ